MDITVPIPRKNTISVAIPEKNTITVDIVRKNTLSVAIDTPAIPIAPAFVSAEVGLIDAYTIDVLFDRVLNEARIPDALDMIADFSGAPNEDLTTGLTWINNGFQTCVISGLDITSAIDDGVNARTINLFGLSGALSNKYIRLIYNLTLNSGTVPYLKIEDALGATVSIAQLSQGINIIEINTTGFDISTLYCYLRNHDISNIPFATNFSLASFGMILLGTRLTGNVLTGLHVYSTSDRAITNGETGTIQYVPNADNDKKLQGTNGARVVAFTESVTNNVTATIPVLQSITCADGYNIVHTYDLALDETSTPATSAYAFPGHTPTTVVVSGLTVTVTVTERIYWGDSDTSAYTKPATNMIKSTGGGEAASFTATAITNNIALHSATTTLVVPTRYTGAPTDALKALINRTFVDLDADGILAKGDCMYIRAVHESLFACQNWIKNAHNSTLVNSPTFTAKQGFTGNGTTSYINNNYTAKTEAVNFALAAATIGVMDLAVGTDNKYRLGAFKTTAPTSEILMGFRTVLPLEVWINSATSYNPSAQTMQAGSHMITTRDGTTVQGYKNGAVSGAPATRAAVTEIPSLVLYELVTNLNGSPVLFSNNQASFSFLGGLLTPTDVANLYTRIAYFFANVGGTF